MMTKDDGQHQFQGHVVTELAGNSSSPFLRRKKAAHQNIRPTITPMISAQRSPSRATACASTGLPG